MNKKVLIISGIVVVAGIITTAVIISKNRKKKLAEVKSESKTTTTTTTTTKPKGRGWDIVSKLLTIGTKVIDSKQQQNQPKYSTAEGRSWKFRNAHKF